MVTLEKLIECLEDKAQVSDKLAVIIYHSKEGSQLVEVLRAWCLFDGFYFFLCRRNSVTDFCMICICLNEVASHNGLDGCGRCLRS